MSPRLARLSLVVLLLAATPAYAGRSFSLGELSLTRVERFCAGVASFLGRSYTPIRGTAKEQLEARGLTFGRRLGAGGMGTVDLATANALDGAQVSYAVKFPLVVPNDAILSVKNANALQTEAGFENELRPGEAELVKGDDGSLALVTRLFPASPTTPHDPAPDLVKFLTDIQPAAFSRDPAKRNEKQMHNVTRGLIAQVKILHAKGIIHCDIKPANILLGTHKRGGNGEETWIPSLRDLGLARRATLDGPERAVGSFQFMGREAFLGAEVTAARDVFGLQATLLRLYFKGSYEGNTVKRSVPGKGWLDLDLTPEDGKDASPMLAWALRSRAVESMDGFEHLFEKAVRAKSMDEYLKIYAPIFDTAFRRADSGDQMDMVTELLQAPVYSADFVKLLPVETRQKMQPVLDRLERMATNPLNMHRAYGFTMNLNAKIPKLREALDKAPAPAAPAPARR